MQGLIFTVLLNLAVTVELPPAADKRVARQCAVLEQQIKRIHSQMRAGYSARKGNRLAARLRKLRKKRAKNCR